MKFILHILAILARSMTMVSLILVVATFPLQRWLNESVPGDWYRPNELPTFTTATIFLFAAFVCALLSIKDEKSKPVLIFQCVFFVVLMVTLPMISRVPFKG